MSPPLTLSRFFSPSSWLRLGRGACFVLGLLTVAALGCGGPNVAGKATVEGKVTVGGKAPAGGTTISFVGSDGTERAGNVDADGSFVVRDVPLGDVNVLVKGTGAPVVVVGGNDLPGMPKSGGVAVPRKYEKAGELKMTVNKGKNTKDFDLTP
jgi:hypothetical protein